MKKLLLSSFCVLIAVWCNAQNATVRLIAGSGTNVAGYSGDGGPDSLAQFNNIGGICMDSHGNMFVQDIGNSRIRKIDGITHQVTTIAGTGVPGYSGDGGPAVLAQLSWHNDWTTFHRYGNLCVDDSDHLYFADESNGRVRKIDLATGIISTVAGGGTTDISSVLYSDSISATDLGFDPCGLCVDSKGNLYVVDGSSSFLLKIDHASSLVRFMCFNVFYGPLSIDGADNIYFPVNYGTVTTVARIDTSGITTNPVAGTDFLGPTPILRNEFTGNGVPATAHQNFYIFNFTTDTSGNLFFTDLIFNNICNKVSSKTGVLTKVLGNINNYIGSLSGYYEDTWNSYYNYNYGEQTQVSSFSDYHSMMSADTFNNNGTSIWALYAGRNGKKYVSLGNGIAEFTESSFSIDRVYLTDSIETPSCTLPSTHAFGFHGVVSGTPGPGDSLYVTVDYNDLLPDWGTDSINHNEHHTFKLPYYSFIDSAGDTAYGFGSNFNYLPPHTYRMPGTYSLAVTYSTGNGYTDRAKLPVVVGNICDMTNSSKIYITNIADSIVSLPCAHTTTVRYKIDGGIYPTDTSYVPHTFDSVYLVIQYFDGSDDVVAVPIDTIATWVSFWYYGYSFDFHYSGYHSYACDTFAGDRWAQVFAISNSGAMDTYQDYDNAEVTLVESPHYTVVNCALGSGVSSSAGSDSSLIVCHSPYNASFHINSTFSYASDTIHSVSYHLNFGDGSDTSIVVSAATDGLGNYYCNDTVYHTYFMPGAFTMAATPLLAGAPALHSTVTIGTSCSPLSGVFYRDGNGNCTDDPGETLLRYWPMAVINNTLGDTTYAWCDTFGHYALSLIDGDTYTIVPNYFGLFGLDSASLSLSCPSATGYTITPVAGSSYTQDFGFTCPSLPTNMDMDVSGWTWGIVPGDTGVVGVWSSNAWGYMCDSLTSTVTLTLDPLLTYLGMWDGPTPTVSGSTLTWTFHTEDNLLDFHADVKVMTSTSATMGASVCNTLHVTPTALPDDDTTNNTYHWCEPVRSSWDPNEKQVSPQGYGTAGYIQNGTALSYIIHFQNTGTAPAQNITINDTISQYLDIATLQVVSSSSAVEVYNPELTNGIVKFRFNNINLPDSTSSPDGSIGYVAYSIQPKPDLAAGTQILNDAGIYFDYNPAVVTNATLNTIEDTLGGITGGNTVCVGGTLTLSNSLTGGSWSCSNGHASIASGVVTGVSAGMDTVTYTMYGGDQKVQKVITVNPLPYAGVITGASSVCVTATTTLADTVSGGVWSVGSLTSVTAGVVTGLATGSDTIRYAVTNGCGTSTAKKPISIITVPAPGTLSGADSVCAGSTITLTPSVSGGAWTSGASLSISSGVVTGSIVGTDSVHYTVANSCGTSMVSHAVTVKPLPAAGPITGADSVCAGSTITLTASGAVGVWTSGPSISVSSGVVTGSIAGTDSVHYTVTNSCGTSVVSHAVTVKPLPVAGSITGADSVCAGSTITLAASGAGGVWTSGPSLSVSSGVVTGSTAGTDSVHYTVVNSCGTSVVSHAVTVKSLPVAGAITGADSVCVGTNITLSESVTGGSWNGGSLFSVAGGVVSAGAVTGTDSVHYTVTNSCGSATVAVPVTVITIPSISSLSGPATVCQGDSVTFTPAIAGGAWSGSPGITVHNGIVTGVSAGIDTVYYMRTNSCGTSGTQTYITVATVPDAGIITGADSVCAGDSVALSNSVSGGVWSAAGSSAAVSATGLVTGTTAGTAIISYAVTNSCGTSAASYSVVVLSAIACEGTTGLGQSSKPAVIEVFPNPNSGSFEIALPAPAGSALLTVTDMYGKVVMAQRLPDGQVKYNVTLPAVAAGTYTVIVQSGNVTYREKMEVW